MITTDSFLRFWAKAIPSLHMHPDDAAVLRMNSHSFELDALIGPWMGPIQTAPVVLLTLNGGVNGVEREEAKIPSARDWTAHNLNGDVPLPTFATNPGGRVWTERRLAQFGLS
jgi:hypothetical protein